MSSTARSRLHPVHVLLALAGATGCTWYSGSKKGEENQLSFFEPNEYPGDTVSSPAGFERPLALGARADAWVLGPGLSTIQSVEIDDPDIVSATFVSAPIVLRAKAEGSTTLRIRTSTTQDSLSLSVVRPDSAHVWVPAATGISLAVPDSYFGDGVALRPGAKITVAAEPRRGQTRLLGFDLFEWKVDPPLLEAASAGVNQALLTASGGAGTATVSTQLGGESVHVTTLAASDVPLLRLYSVASDLAMPPEISSVGPKDLGGLALAATDSNGHLVKPGPGDAVAVEVLEGTVRVLGARMSGNYLALETCTGTGTIRIRYVGGSRDVPIAVTADVADAGCL